jgi:hypothetical protein
MKAILRTMLVVGISFIFANCAQTEARTPVAIKAVASGSHFDAVGRISLHQGEPCAPQVMFNFQPRNAKTQVWLAARLQDSRLLTEAARRGRRVHILGVWRHGRDKHCAYVEVAQATQE